MRSSNLFLSLSVFAALTATGCLDTPSDVKETAEAQPQEPFMPLFKEGANPGSYIITLREGADVDAASADLVAGHGLSLGHVYHHALNGFSAKVPPGRLQALSEDPRVEKVEEDLILYAFAQTIPWGVDRMDADVSSTLAGDGAGVVTGVRIYIIDTGIRSSHPDLNVAGLTDFTGAGSAEDNNGHGTHVAGSAAAMDNADHVVGVAPGAPLYGVKVLGADGSGSTSNIVAGIDFVTGEKAANPGVPMVANMSLGGKSRFWTAIDAAVQRSIDAGVVYSVAAGNDGQDAKGYTPAHVGPAITVGAYDAANKAATWSNYGATVDIQAPGVAILSTWNDGATKSISGTSMAAPHVAGAAALLLSSNPAMTPAQVRDRLVADSKSWVTAVKPKTTKLSVYVGTY